MPTRTGQRTTASATTTAPKKDSAKTTQAAKKAAQTRKQSSSSSGKQTVELTGHAFPAGTEVAVYPALSVGAERHAGAEIKSAKVDDKGVLKVSGLDYGQYTAVANVEVEAQIDKNSPNRQATPTERRELNFAVKDLKKIREEKYRRTGGNPIV